MGWLDSLIDQALTRWGGAAEPTRPVPPHTPTPATAYTKTIPAPPLAQYPSSADAAEARRGGFGYGEPYSAYVEGQAGRIFADRKGPIPWDKGLELGPFQMVDDSGYVAEKAQTLPTTQKVTPEVRDRLQDFNTRAALAVNRSPVGSLGYEPRATTFDVSRKANYGPQGMTLSDTPGIPVYVRDMPPGHVSDDDNISTLTHESMHRGLRMLLDSPLARSLPAHLRNRLLNEETGYAENESLVRQLMTRDVGNPERSALSDELRAGGTPWTPEEFDILDRIAQTIIKTRRPRGPR